MDDLINSGFIKRDFSWNLANAKKSKLSQYRICDNYLRFYIKNIAPHKERIIKGDFKLANWDNIMGLQFENLVLNNRALIKKALNIETADVIYDNPFFQQATKLQKGCQIDYLIETKFNTLYVCEIKFSKNPISSEIINEVNEKINRLKMPKHFTCRKVLIHVNGVTDLVIKNGDFSNIIDFSDLLLMNQD